MSHMKKQKSSKKIGAKPTKARPHSEVLNDNATLGQTERLTSTLEHAQEKAAQESSNASLLSPANLAAVGVITQKFSVATISAFSRDIAKEIRDLKPIEIISGKIGEGTYRTDGLGSRYNNGSTEDLSRQLMYAQPTKDDAALLSPPVIYENESKDLACVSGWKRIQAAKKIALSNISCRVLTYKVVHDILTKHNLHNEKHEALKAAFSYFVYSESEHTSPLDDNAMLNYLCGIKENHLFARKDFHEVLQILGLSRKSPRYNDLYRLWKVACEPTAYRLVKEKKVKLRIFKNQTNIDIMYHGSSKAQQIAAKIEERIATWKENNDSEKTDCEAIDLDDYDDGEIQRIIFEVDQPFLSKDEIDGRKYRSPRKNIKVDGAKIEVQGFKIDFDDKSDNNVRNIVETLYVLESVIKDLRDYGAAIGSQLVDSFEKPVPPSHRGTKIVHGEKYYDFIRKNRLWDFCNLVAMSLYLRERGDFKVSKEEMKTIDRYPAPERAKKLIQIFREYAMVRDGQDIVREHIEANATDEQIRKHAAPRVPPLGPLPDDGLWEPKREKNKIKGKK